MGIAGIERFRLALDGRQRAGQDGRMTIKFFCPAGHPILASSRHQGEMVQCERCGRVAIVPQPGEGAQIGGEAQKRRARDELGTRRAGDTRDKGPPAGGSTPTSDSSPPPPAIADAGAGQPADRRPADHHPANRRRPTPHPPPLSRATAKAAPGDQPQAVERAIYRADAGNISSARALALLLGAIVIFSLIPAVQTVGINLEFAPGWARAVFLLAGLQLAFLLWMVATPDFSSAWVAMLLFAAVAALYALISAMVLAAPADKPLPLGLGEVRNSAGQWCGAVAALMIIGTYAAGQVSTRWEQAADRAPRIPRDRDPRITGTKR